MKQVLKLLLCMLIVIIVGLKLEPNIYAIKYEQPFFPSQTMSLTQVAYESVSHGQQNAIDFVPSGRVVAPFTGRIVYRDPNWGYVVLQSINPVRYADGTLDYMTIGFMHDSNISDLEYYYQNRGNENGIIEQGKPFYDAGGQGGVYDKKTGEFLYFSPYAYGVHVHLTIHRGQVERGYPYGAGDVFAFDALFIDSEYTTTI